MSNTKKRNKKNQIFAIVVAVLLVLGMILPLVLSAVA